MVVGFEQHEIRTSESTRSARLKWVVIVADDLPIGHAVNAAVSVATATALEVPGIQGPDAVDADGGRHAGLPWAGCTVLTASRPELERIRAAAATDSDLSVTDMPASAQSTRVYDEYLAAVRELSGDALDLLAVSLVGPRNRIDRMVKRLPLR